MPTYFYDGLSWSPWTGATPIPLQSAFQALGLLVDYQGWFDGTVVGRHKIGGTEVNLQGPIVDAAGRLWATYSNHLYVASTTDANGPVWTRVGHLDWDTFMTARIVPDSTANILYVVAGDAKVRTTPLPAAP